LGTPSQAPMPAVGDGFAEGARLLERASSLTSMAMQSADLPMPRWLRSMVKFVRAATI
jgi:hypothetical protein